LTARHAFDPCRFAILLIGGNTSGDGRWQDTQITQAVLTLNELRHVRGL
jgi:hypothetical protein